MYLQQLYWKGKGLYIRFTEKVMTNSFGNKKIYHIFFWSVVHELKLKKSVGSRQTHGSGRGGECCDQSRAHTLQKEAAIRESMVTLESFK